MHIHAYFAAGKVIGNANFAGVGRAQPVFSTPSHQHDAGRRRQRGVWGAETPARYICIYIYMYYNL